MRGRYNPLLIAPGVQFKQFSCLADVLLQAASSATRLHSCAELMPAVPCLLLQASCLITKVLAMPPHWLPCSSMVDIAMEGRWEGKGVAVFYLVSELASKSTIRAFVMSSLLAGGVGFQGLRGQGAWPSFIRGAEQCRRKLLSCLGAQRCPCIPPHPAPHLLLAAVDLMIAMPALSLPQELTLDMLHLLVYCAFFAVVFSTYGIPLHLVSLRSGVFFPMTLCCSQKWHVGGGHRHVLHWVAMLSHLARLLFLGSTLRCSTRGAARGPWCCRPPRCFRRPACK